MTAATIYSPDIHISGDVRIDPRAVIASGVILQAAPNSYIAIAAGVCIGAGSIIQAHQGNIDIQAGTIIGAGTLIIGKSSIGENVCIGYGTTIFRASIISATILPPNTLVGDISRQGSSTTNPTFQASNTGTQTSATFDPWQDIPEVQAEIPVQDPTPEIPNQASHSPPSAPVEAPEPTEIFEDIEIVTEPEINTQSLESLEETKTNNSKPPIVGKAYINQLLTTLFPHQNSINPLDGSS